MSRVLNVSRDYIIYKEIVYLLLDLAPDGARSVIVNAELSGEGDYCEFEYDYINNVGERNWFVSKSGLINQRLRKLLVSLRSYLCYEFKSSKKPFWKKCCMTVEIYSMKMKINFDYE